MLDRRQKTIATFIHLSTFSRFIIPFGNFIGPLILWLSSKEQSEFIDAHGKQALNFQISIFIYCITLGVIAIPLFILGVLGTVDILSFNSFDNFQWTWGQPSLWFYLAGSLGGLLLIGFILELVLIIIASLRARDGQFYKYPLTISFLK